MQVYQLAKELGYEKGEFLKALKEMGSETTKASQNLTDDEEALLRDVFPVKEAIKKQPTRPWDADNNPWTLDLLKVMHKRKDFRLRWVNRDSVQKKQEQGWLVANKKDYGGLGDAVVGEESADGTVIRRREMVLLEMPEELARQRDAFIRHKTDRRSADARSLAKREVGKVEQAYGEKILTEDKFTSVLGR